MMTHTMRPWMLVLAAGLIVWAGTLHNSFHYDDVHSVVDNIHLRITSFAAITQAIPTYLTDPGTFSIDADKGMYRPLLVTSFALNHLAGTWLGVGGYDVVGFHVVNLALHVGCALLVMWLTGLLGGSRRAGLLAGVLFVLHPVASEPVNYISSRSESLSVLFYLLGVCLYLRAESGNRRWLWGAWLAMAAGLLSKSTTITLPAALLLLDLFVLCRGDLRRLGRRLLHRHLGGWVVAGVYLAIISGNGWLGRSVAQEVRGPWEQALTQMKGAVYNIMLLATPVRQSVEPQFAEQTHFSVEVAGPLLLLLSMVVAAFWLARSACWRALFLLCWACLHLLPTLVVPLNVLVNERRAYGPMAILCVGAGILLASLGMRQQRRVLAWAGCLVLSLLSIERSQTWADEFSLWEDTVRKAPLMSRAHLYLGNAHKDAALHTQDVATRSRHWQAASESYATAYERARDLDLQLRALNNRGGVHFALYSEKRAGGNTRRDLDVAEQLFRTAVEKSPDYADAIINLGSTVLEAARWAKTRQARQDLLRQSIIFYERALQVRPNHYQAHSNLGVANQDLGHLEAAERHYLQALYLHPGDWLTLKNLASVLLLLADRDLASDTDEAARQRLVEAHRMVQRALRLNPAVANGRQVLEAIESRLRTLKERD